MGKKNILIVDDEQINLLLLKITMEKNGYTAIPASNGKEAMEEVKKQKPDLILLDIMMPGIDGLEVCSILKGQPETQDIPIILLTALNAREDIDKGIEKGANDFISKPFNEKELLFRVSSLLRMKKLDSFIIKQNAFFTDFETMSEKLLTDPSKNETNSKEYIMELVSRILIPESPASRTPAGIYISLVLPEHQQTGIYFSVEKGVVSKKKCIIPITKEALLSASILKDNILISNWQSTAENLDEYQKIFPKELPEEAGEVHNFLYYEDEIIRILPVNYNHDIQTFDISMFRHLVQLSRTILRIQDHMKISEHIYHTLSTSLSRIAEIRDDYKGKHRRIREICGIFCSELNCSKIFVSQLQEAVALFDIGKLLVDQSVLLKNSPLNNTEIKYIQKVPEFAEMILDSEPRLLVTREIAAGLYEKWDGSGYPHGKKGEEIPFSARIISLLNTYDSLRSTRSYRKDYTHKEAVKIISFGDDRVKPEHFDPKVLSAFLKAEDKIEKYYDGVVQAREV